MSLPQPLLSRLLCGISLTLMKRVLIHVQPCCGERATRIVRPTSCPHTLLAEPQSESLAQAQARQARLRASLGDADYQALGRVLTTLSAEAQTMLAETRDSTAPRR